MTALSEDGNLLHSSLVYIFGRIKMGPDQMNKIMKDLPASAVKTFKSTADQLIELGEKLGLRKGEELGLNKGIEIGGESQIKILLRLWHREQGRSISEIAVLLNWSEKEVQDKIDLWGI